MPEQGEERLQSKSQESFTCISHSTDVLTTTKSHNSTFLCHTSTCILGLSLDPVSIFCNKGLLFLAALLLGLVKRHGEYKRKQVDVLPSKN